MLMSIQAEYEYRYIDTLDTSTAMRLTPFVVQPGLTYNSVQNNKSRIWYENYSPFMRTIQNLIETSKLQKEKIAAYYS